jgi:uncharacterized protein (DUF1800 family)
MNRNAFLSLKWGFDGRLAAEISGKGAEKTLERLFQNPHIPSMPDFMADAPRDLAGYREVKSDSEERKKEFRRIEIGRRLKLQSWVLQEAYLSANPLHEKMVLFLHNHFVSSVQKVKATWFMYQQHQLFRKHAFGNFKDLTLAVLHDNAMLVYLDNHQNRAQNINENLSRELLELFTLGIGNYQEGDIREGARILAGLAPGNPEGTYVERWRDPGEKNYLGRSGNMQVKDMVDAIFAHPKMGFHLSKKLLRWFRSDEPDDRLVNELAEVMRRNQFEMKPVLRHLLLHPDFEKSAGDQIKDPLTFLFQTAGFMGIQELPAFICKQFLKAQGMELLNPPNVKGWPGGRSWLDVQRLLARNKFVSQAVNGKFRGANRKPNEATFEDDADREIRVRFSLPEELKNGTDIVQYFCDQLVFQCDESYLKRLGQVLPYDFDRKAPSSHLGLSRLAEYIFQSPEYQII